MIRLRIWAILTAVHLGVAYSQTTIEAGRPGQWHAAARVPGRFGPSPVQRFAVKSFGDVAKKAMASFKKEAEDVAKSGYKPAVEMSFGLKPVIGVNEPDLVSGYFDQFWDTGGAHPNSAFRPITVGLVKGKPQVLHLRDVLIAGGDPISLLRECLLPAVNQIKLDRQLQTLKSIPNAYQDSFFVTPSGITWLFEPYGIGAYVEGAYRVKLTWAELSGRLDPKGPLRRWVARAPNPIQLDGTVSYREKMALPAGARINFQLLVVGPQGQLRVVARQSVLATTSPTPFRLRFQPTLAAPSYALLIEIEGGGLTLFRTRGWVAVPPTGWGAPQEILVSRD